MPILNHEIDIYPADLLATCEAGSEWWALYTLSRREKELMRHLHALELPFYAPMIPKRYRSPGGRLRTSYIPLFSNYVFLCGDEDARYRSLTTRCVSRCVPVTNSTELIRDLKQFQQLIAMDVALTPESRLEPGDRVRVRSGRFRGFEGRVIRREGDLRLLVSVNFLQQGASLLLEDCEFERI